MLNGAIVSVLALAGVAVSAAALAQAASGAKTLRADEISWADNPALPKGAKSSSALMATEIPALPKGVKAVILMGDPEQGAYITRVMVPAKTKIMPHSHPTENLVTVLSGTLLYAEGDKFDAAKLKRYPAGSFIVEKANVPHFMSGKGPVIFQVSVPAKSTFDYVDAKDDPRKK